MNGLAHLGRRQLVVGATSAIGLALAGPVAGSIPSGRARYRVTLIGIRPLRLSVEAELPMDGDRLGMASSYPAELSEMAGKGWTALIRNLVATDAAGRRLAVTPQGSAGWTLARSVNRVRLRYVVDFSIFQQAGWSSPRESAIVDSEHAILSCRALFITTAGMAGADVAIRTPDNWHAVAPWPALGTNRQRFAVNSVADLTENMLVLTSRPPEQLTSANFTMSIAAMGHWRPLQPMVRETLRTVLSLQTGMMGTRQRENYNVILLPTLETGGEAYRQSFAYSHENPSAGNRGIWANTLAHELFHYWNGSRLQGRDYSATQWFQEGFTEYVANLTLLVGRITGPDEFLAKLSTHVANYGRLTTSLEAIGNRKGPPLYSAGALVAFSFDAMIRASTQGKSSLGTFFRRLWLNSGEGTEKYAWADIQAALNAVAPGNWADYHERFIRGQERLPLADAFRQTGLQLSLPAVGNPRVSPSPVASSAAKAVWEGLNSRM